MQTRMIAAVLSLAGLGLAGGVAGDNGDDCTYGATPVPGGYYRACLFEENARSYSYRHCDWTGCYDTTASHASNQLADVVFLTHDGLPASGGVAAYAVQFEGSGQGRGTDPRSHHAWSYAHTEAGVMHDVRTPLVGTRGGAHVVQYDDSASVCNNWGCWGYDDQGTRITADQTVGPLRVFAGYIQHRDIGGACQQHVYLYSVVGAGTPPQPCGVEIPQLMANPHTRFPDWPDDTGLPFL